MKQETASQHTLQLTDSHIILRLQEASENESVFAATRDWSLARMCDSVRSRGDLFDRRAVIVLERDGKDIFRSSASDLPVTIGRGEKVDLRIDNQGVSRMHCRLEQVGRLVRLRDDGSKNGTLLNGRRIVSEDLCEGDIIQIGSVSLRVKRL